MRVLQVHTGYLQPGGEDAVVAAEAQLLRDGGHQVDLFGGRQSARSIHFLVAWLLVAFVAVHVFEVLVSGVWNHLRSMVTGRYRIDAPAPDAVISKETSK